MTESSSQADTPKAKTSATTLWVWGKPWSRWRTIRLLLLLLWFLIFLLWIFTERTEALLLFEIISAIVFAILLWPWIRGPYRLYKRSWLPPHADFKVQSTAFSTIDFSGTVLEPLHRLGFEFAGLLSKDFVLDRPVVQIAFYIHPTSQDSAQVARIMTRSKIIHTVIFKTRFDDGFAFETGLTNTAPLFRSDPQFPVFRFPQLRSRADLYRIHCKLKERFTTNRSPVIADKSAEMAKFIARAEKVHQRNVERDYKLNPAGDRYVYTLRGAIRRAWLMTWPVRAIREMRVESKAMKLAAELGLPINPKFGCLEESIRQRKEHSATS